MPHNSGVMVNVPWSTRYSTSIAPKLLLSPLEIDGEGAQIRAAMRDGEGQDVCVATYDFEESWTSIAPRLVHQTFPFALFPGQAAGPLRLELLFDAEENKVAWAALSGLMDVRVQPPLVEAQAWCDMTAGALSWAGSCTPCPVDGAAFCQPLELIGARLVEEEDLPGLQHIGQDNCHPDCPASADNPDCDLTEL